MKLIMIFTIVLIAQIASANDFKDVKSLAMRNGFIPSSQVIKAIIKASHKYKLDPLELATIGIIETGLGKYARDRVNKNGTVDHGLFQINTVNEVVCIEYDLSTVEGSSFCAAKLLSRIKRVRHDYMGVYHSKTKSKKAIYLLKVSQVLAKNAE